MKYDNGLYKLLNALNSINKDTIVIAVGVDKVGLAKDASVTGTTRLYPKFITEGDISLTNTSSTATSSQSVLSTPVSISEDGEYVLVIAINTATTVKLVLIQGTKSYDYYVNHGSALAANSWYNFHMFLHDGDQINIEIDVPPSTTVEGKFRIFKT